MARATSSGGVRRVNTAPAPAASRARDAVAVADLRRDDARAEPLLLGRRPTTSNACSTGCHAGGMTGGMSRRRGPTLAERRVATPVPRELAPGPATDEPSRSRPVVTRHCWVVGLPDAPGRWAGLLAEWRQDATGGWRGRVVYARDSDGAPVLVEEWVPAAHLEPAR